MNTLFGLGRGLYAVIMLLLFILIPCILIFTVWMFFDCLFRPVKDKILWLLVIFFLSVLGAILYYRIGRHKFEEE